MGAPPPDSHTKTDMDKNGTTSPSHQQQQAPPPANMVSNSSSPASAPQRGRACNHPNCGRRGFDRCTWGQPQPPGTGTRAPNPPRVGSWRGGRGGGGRGGTNGQNGHAQSMQPPAATATATTATAPAATGGPVVETVKKEDVGTQPQPQLKASDSATSSDEEFGASQISARMQAQTSSLAQKFLQRPAAPSGEWNLDRFQPVKFGESPGALQGSTHSQSVQTPQTPALTTPTSVGGPVTDTHKKNDTNEQPQPKASNPAPATTTKFSAFDGLDGKQYSSKAPELSPNASQAASNINSSVPNGGSGTVAVGAKEINDNHGTQSRPPGLPGMSVPACKTSVSTPGAPNGSDPALETRPATDPSQDEQSVQTAPVGAQASSATAQSAEGPTKRGQDTENKTESDMAPRQHDPAMSATSSSFAFGNPLSQKQPAMAFGAPPAQNTSFSSSPGLGAIRPSFSASFSRGATVGPESGTTTRNPITFGSTQPLLSPIVKRFDVKGEGSSHGRASEPPPALKERARESQGPPRKRFKFDSTILVLVGADEDEFTVHKHVIIRHSSYFNTQCSSTAQAIEKCVRLPDLDPEMFDCYLQWVYHGEIVTLATENADSVLGAQEALWRSEGNVQALAKVEEVLSLAKLYMTANYLGDKKLKNATVDKFMDGSQVAFGDPGLTIAFINYLWGNTKPADNFRQAALKRGYMSTAAPRMSNWLEENRHDLNTEFITELAIRLAKAKPMFDPENAPAGRCAYHDHDEEAPPCA